MTMPFSKAREALAFGPVTMIWPCFKIAPFDGAWVSSLEEFDIFTSPSNAVRTIMPFFMGASTVSWALVLVGNAKIVIASS